MLIRCPECFFTRQVNDGKVPVGSEYATCPKCKKRFRFRTLTPEELAEAESAQAAQAARPEESLNSATDAAVTPDFGSSEPGEQAREGGASGLGAARPSTSERSDTQEEAPENAGTAAGKEGSEDDLWNAVENLNRHWEENADSRSGGFSERSGPAGGEPDDSEAESGEEGRAEDRFAERNRFFDDADAPDVPDVADYADEPGDPAKPGLFGERRPEGYDHRGAPRYSGQYGQEEEEDFAESGKPSFLADHGSVPWEYRGGFLNPQALVRTILLSFTRIPEFFSGLPARGSLLPAMIFALLMRGLQFIVTFAFVTFDFVTPEGERINSSLAGIAQISIPELLITTVFIVILLQFASSWIVNFMVRLVAGRSHFGLTFRVVAYSLAPLIFALIPQLGLMIGEIGSLTLFTVGLRHAYRLSWQKTMMVVIPLMLLMFLINLSTLRIFAG